MSENNTKETDQSRSFEERVFLRFDAIDARLGSLDARVEKLEMRQYDTKPIWEQALAAIAEINLRMDKGFEQTWAAIAEINLRMDKGFEQTWAAIAETNLRVDKALAAIAEINLRLDKGFELVKVEFEKLRHEIEHAIHGVERKIDALNHNILQVQADQRYADRRLQELESQTKPT